MKMTSATRSPTKKTKETTRKTSNPDSLESWMIHAGKAAVAFSREQWKSDSELSKMAQGMVKVLEDTIGHLDLETLTQESQKYLLRLSDDMKKTLHDVKSASLLQEFYKLEQKVIEADDKTKDKRTKKNRFQAVATYLEDAMQSPFIKAWEDRASQVLRDVAVADIEMESAQPGTERTTNLKESVPIAVNKRSMYFMEEKHSRDLRNRVSQSQNNIPFFASVDGSSQPSASSTSAFVVEVAHKATSVSPSAKLVLQFLRVWTKYISQLILLTLMMRSLLMHSSSSVASIALLETIFSSRLAKYVTWNVVERIESSEGNEPSTKEAIGLASVPYFARARE
eukprot:CAMPEP_0178775292 /NCGR_PEP_ID=MMETSP0744-20121128/24115_1 /TAXON_ID=913974 /ORGANISM="Nitzschia punctata, Strain CCMP561" /LENGTH=338 /DNA_ID=CAMNT_0020432261 /DNA_START=1 /DNA_END=1017 /DNA_ORIENTATION=-